MSLHLAVPPNFKPVIIMEEILSELLSLVSNGAPQKTRDITKRVLRDNKQVNISPAFADVNKSALFKEFQKNLELVKSQLRKLDNSYSGQSRSNVTSSALSWLLDEIFALQIADEAVKMFAEEKDLSQLMMATNNYENPFAQTLCSILVRLLQGLQNNEAICPSSVHISLVTNWLPVIAKLKRDINNEVQKKLEGGLSALVATLSIAEQEQVFKIWVSSCLKSESWPDLSAAFDLWCKNLRLVQNGKKHPVSSEVSETPSFVSSMKNGSSSS